MRSVWNFFLSDTYTDYFTNSILMYLKNLGDEGIEFCQKIFCRIFKVKLFNGR